MSRRQKDEASHDSPTPRAVVTLDLRGVRCPLNWAKAKVRLEGMRRGEELSLLLDDPRGLRDIPRAAEAEGYVVGEAQAEGSYWRLPIVV